MVIHPMPRESKRFGNLPSLDHGTIDGRDETNDAGEEINSLPPSVVILEFAHSHWISDIAGRLPTNWDLVQPIPSKRGN